MNHHRLVAGMRTAIACSAVAAALVAAPLTAVAAPDAGPQAAPAPPTTVTPYPGEFTDLYGTPGGRIAGSSYIWPEVANLRERLSFDLARMRDQTNVNTVGLYDVEKLSDATKDRLFAELERNHQKAVVRIERYDRCGFAFDSTNTTHADAEDVMARYTRDEPDRARTGLLKYLVKKGKLKDVAYFMINLPVDDPNVTRHFVTPEYPDGRQNPLWATSQVAYVDQLIARLRSVLGDAAKAQLYIGVFYGWDLSYRIPSYADIAHPADGYSLTSYTYPAAEPPDETADAATLINAPRLQQGMDKIMAQYPAAPKVVEYGFHTVEYNHGVKPGQTAGLVTTLAAKRLALPATTDFYRDGSSAGQPFNVRGTLYFAQNLYKPEGTPLTLNDWTLAYPNTGRLEAENRAVARSYRPADALADTPTPVQAAADAEAAAASHAPDPQCPPLPSGSAASGAAAGSGAAGSASGAGSPAAARAATAGDSGSVSATVTGTASASASGSSVALRAPGEALQFFNLAAAPSLQLRYRSAAGATVTLRTDGASPADVRLAPARTWTTVTLDRAVMDQTAVKLTLRSGTVEVDWLAGQQG